MEVVEAETKGCDDKDLEEIEEFNGAFSEDSAVCGVDASSSVVVVIVVDVATTVGVMEDEDKILLMD